MIGVLLPAYNAADTVGGAVRSILDQTERDLELILVDDGSTDGTADAARAAAAGDPRLRVLARPHEGLVAALEAGRLATDAPFVARMDADDWSHPERLARQRALLEADPTLGVASCLVAQAGGGEGYAAHVAWLNGLVTPEAIALARFVEAPVAHPSVMVRREVFARHGGYRDGDFPEDHELWLRWLAAGVRFAKVPMVLLTWHDRPGRLSRTDPRYRVDAFYALKARYLAPWLAAHNPHHPRIVLWGAGKTSRRRARPLLAEGLQITAYVDIDPRRVGRVSAGRPILGPDDLGPPGDAFVVAYVGVRGAGGLIRAQLEARGWREGRDFLLAA